MAFSTASAKPKHTPSSVSDYRLREFIPLRTQPDQKDDHDAQRVELVKARWHAQDASALGYAKTVEEHVRMLSGRQWDVWSDVLGRFIDVLQFMNEDERRWRQRPVMDYLGYWYQLTLSKATENQPQIAFAPATSDRRDAMLAETMDTVWKTLYDQGEMDDRLMRLAAWAIVAGETYLMTRAEFDDGPSAPVMGPAILSMMGADGVLIERAVDDVPFDAEGNPQATLVNDPENPGEYGYEVPSDVYTQRKGSLKFEPLCPLEIRAQSGAHIPWNDKQWVIHRWFLSPEQVHRQYGVACNPDTYADDSDGSGGYLERLLFGSGYFGAAQNNPTAQSTDTSSKDREGFVCGFTMWEKPDAEHTPADEENGVAGGRLLVVTAGGEVLWDSLRPYMTEAAGPIRRASYIDIPGRPKGSTPLEKMVPLQKRLNRVEAQIAEHTNLVTNPILLVNELAGIGDDEWVARPGMVIPHGFTGAGDPAKWLAPPSLSIDVWKHKQEIVTQLFIIGAMQGNQSAPPTASASGELVEQLRFNADRPLAPLTRSLAILFADVAEDALAILPTIWTEEQMLAYAGEDNVVRTLTVLPEMFEGRVNARPVLTASAYEATENKQARVIKMYELGFWGPPGTPMANAALADLMQFPNLNRAMRPGGIDRVTAEQNLGHMLRGDLAADLPVYPWYDLSIHLAVLEQYLKSPEFKEIRPEIQEQFVLYREQILGAQQAQAMEVVERQVMVNAAATAKALETTARAGKELPKQLGAGPKDDGPPNGGPPSTPEPGAKADGPAPGSPPSPPA